MSISLSELKRIIESLTPSERLRFAADLIEHGGDEERVHAEVMVLSVANALEACRVRR